MAAALVMARATSERLPQALGNYLAAEKPGVVPDVIESLDLLGINLDVNESDFVNLSDTVPPATPLQKNNPPHPLHDWLKDYEGN